MESIISIEPPSRLLACPPSPCPGKYIPHLSLRRRPVPCECGHKKTSYARTWPGAGWPDWQQRCLDRCPAIIFAVREPVPNLSQRESRAWQVVQETLVTTVYGSGDRWTQGLDRPSRSSESHQATDPGRAAQFKENIDWDGPSPYATGLVGNKQGQMTCSSRSRRGVVCCFRTRRCLIGRRAPRLCVLHTTLHGVCLGASLMLSRCHGPRRHYGLLSRAVVGKEFIICAAWLDAPSMLW